MRAALWRYRIRVSGFELPGPVANAQQEFDERLADVLDGMADRMSGEISDRRNHFSSSVAGLEKTIQTYDAGKPQGALPAQLGGFLSLSRKIVTLTISLDNEMSVHEDTLRPEMPA